MRNLHEFSSVTPPYYPSGGVVADATGALYGVTEDGTAPGTVYELSPPAVGQTSWKLTRLHGFGVTPGDGIFPRGTLIMDATGALYGTTSQGGANGTGTVFRLTPPAAGRTQWHETILHSFGAGTSDYDTNADGIGPVGGPLVLDSTGHLFGTTSEGGRGGGATCPVGSGVVFELSPPAPGAQLWKATVLHTFTNCRGQIGGPGSIVLGPKGVLYGVASSGGSSFTDFGGVFMLTPPAAGQKSWGYRVLHVFSDPSGNDGAGPGIAPVIGSGGALYGTTHLGGGFNSGVVYELTPPRTGSTTWTERIIRDLPNLSFPLSGLVLDSAGALYGTTSAGGPYHEGTVYRLDPPAVANGPWQATTLIAFDFTNGACPVGPLLLDKLGVIRGTTFCGGPFIGGTVFEVLP